MMSAQFKKQLKARILVVDDDPTIALTLHAILTEEGYEVGTALSGEEAIVKAGYFNPHLLITDLVMGAMTGMEAADRITAILPDCKVLFFSGSATFDEAAQSAPKKLVYSFVRKPMPVPDLLSTIAYIVSSVNTVYDPIDTIGDYNCDIASQRWRVTRMAPLLANQ